MTPGGFVAITTAISGWPEKDDPLREVVLNYLLEAEKKAYGRT